MIAVTQQQQSLFSIDGTPYKIALTVRQLQQPGNKWNGVLSQIMLPGKKFKTLLNSEKVFFIRVAAKEALVDNLIYLFMSRHEVHSMNTHTAERRLIKTDKTERSTMHWSRRNHRVVDTFCNCIEDRTRVTDTFLTLQYCSLTRDTWYHATAE